MAEVSGYGNTVRLVVPRPKTANDMRPLKAAYVPTVAHTSCVKYFKEHHPNYHVTKNMICAGHPCQDDACQVKIIYFSKNRKFTFITNIIRVTAVDL